MRTGRLTESPCLRGRLRCRKQVGICHRGRLWKNRRLTLSQVRYIIIPNVSAAKIAITMEESLVEQVDRLVRERVYPNRSRAIQDAVADKLRRMDRGRLARECDKLDPEFEQAFAEEGIGSEIAQWPQY